MTSPDNDRTVSPQAADEADILETIGLHLSPLGSEPGHESDIAELYDLYERRLANPCWVDFHSGVVQGVKSVATGQETRAAVPEATGADQFVDIPSEDDVPEQLREMVRLIADCGLLANYRRIEPSQLLDLLRHPRAINYAHLEIWASHSPYWKVRLKTPTLPLQVAAASARMPVEEPARPRQRIRRQWWPANWERPRFLAVAASLLVVVVGGGAAGGKYLHDKLAEIARLGQQYDQAWAELHFEETVTPIIQVLPAAAPVKTNKVRVELSPRVDEGFSARGIRKLGQRPG